jgi:hypothetical protein
MYMLLPKLTDVRGSLNVAGADTIECPAGSGKYYQCKYVDDRGKGFANEHRVVIMAGAGFWPTPIP